MRTKKVPNKENNNLQFAFFVSLHKKFQLCSSFVYVIINIQSKRGQIIFLRSLDRDLDSVDNIRVIHISPFYWISFLKQQIELTGRGRNDRLRSATRLPISINIDFPSFGCFGSDLYHVPTKEGRRNMCS